MKNVKGSSLTSSEFEVDDCESREFRDNSIYFALWWLRLGLADTPLACTCLRSLCSEEFVEERFPTTWLGVWVVSCLVTDDVILSLWTDWSLTVVTLGGPGIKKQLCISDASDININSVVIHLRMCRCCTDYEAFSQPVKTKLCNKSYKQPHKLVSQGVHVRNKNGSLAGYTH